MNIKYKGGIIDDNKQTNWLLFVRCGCFYRRLIHHPTVGTRRLLIAAAVAAGYHVIAEGVIETIQDSKKQHRFAPNIHILMALAAVGAIAIGSYEEAAMLILIFAGADFLEDYVENKSRKEITALLAMAPLEARRYGHDGEFEVVPVAALKIGDRLQILNGAQVPTDGVIIAGTASLDESAISGRVSHGKSRSAMKSSVGRLTASQPLICG